MRGSHTHGYGSKKKHRGSGSRGGVGYGGSFQHKKIFLKKKEPEHFAKQKFKSLRRKGITYTLEVINLGSLPLGKEVELPGVKVLSKGQAEKGKIGKAAAFSASAMEKLEEAGGKAIILGKPEEPPTTTGTTQVKPASDKVTPDPPTGTKQMISASD